MFIIDYFMYLYFKITKKRIDYQLYLKTSHWKKVKRKALKRANYRCAFCCSRERLETHHSNYNCLFNEHKYDVIVLCHRCHYVHHKYIYKTIKEAS